MLWEVLPRTSRADCGLAGLDRCRRAPGRPALLEAALDIRQCRVHQFRSYRLCLLPTVCSASFSLERAAGPGGGAGGVVERPGENRTEDEDPLLGKSGQHSGEDMYFCNHESTKNPVENIG